jgi:hypothetical protein
MVVMDWWGRLLEPETAAESDSAVGDFGAGWLLGRGILMMADCGLRRICYKLEKSQNDFGRGADFPVPQCQRYTIHGRLSLGHFRSFHPEELVTHRKIWRSRQRGTVRVDQISKAHDDLLEDTGLTWRNLKRFNAFRWIQNTIARGEKCFLYERWSIHAVVQCAQRPNHSEVNWPSTFLRSEIGVWSPFRGVLHLSEHRDPFSMRPISPNVASLLILGDNQSVWPTF